MAGERGVLPADPVGGAAAESMMVRESVGGLAVERSHTTHQEWFYGVLLLQNLSQRRPTGRDGCYTMMGGRGRVKNKETGDGEVTSQVIQ